MFGKLEMKCPSISNRFIFADDAKLAAQLSCALSSPGVYLPVCDGPRMQRPDNEFEVLRRRNAAGRARATEVFTAGLSDRAFDELINRSTLAATCRVTVFFPTTTLRL
jgi:hypothetical protein